MKKIIKYLCVAFVVTGILTGFGVSAISVNYADLKIPAFQQLYTSTTKKKTSDNRQKMRQVSASHAVRAKIFTDSGDTRYEQLVSNQDVTFGGNSATPGDTWFVMQTVGVHLTSTSFYGNWFID